MNHSTPRINYDRMSRFYDLFAGTSERRFTGIGLHMLAAQNGESVLEIGFGTGHSLVALTQAVGGSGKVTGIDISKGMLRVTQSRLKQSGFAEQVDLRLGDAAYLPFNAAGFDAVFASFTLELFDLPEIPVVLKECRRVLRPEGRIGVVALAKTDGVAVRIYEWAHAKFPDFIDCRPIYVHKVIEAAGFQITEIVERSMWGLPVKIVIAHKLS
ncbi:MAG: methyltransferase domain-containing protein [Chloroflexi bacterium]|nr:methyltransferase domain-containing protein [Chloroflexota bacterium]